MARDLAGERLPRSDLWDAGALRPTSLQAPYEPYLAHHLHIPPSTARFDETGEDALAALDRALEEAGPDTVAAFVCEPVSAAAMPGYSPPVHFWEGVAERREKYGFLVVFDEVVTGFGRTGSWFAYQQLPLQPDVISFGKAAGAGYAPLAGILAAEHVYEAVASGSREFEHGHTWDGAPQLCAVGLAVLEALESEGLVERVRDRGPSLRDELEAAVGDLDIVREVRGRGFLLGVELVDPRDGESFLPGEVEISRPRRRDGARARASRHDLALRGGRVRPRTRPCSRPPTWRPIPSSPR